MELVDLTGIWRDGEFYKVAPIDQCVGCVFLPDVNDHEGKGCYDRLKCTARSNSPRYIFINTDENSVAQYVRERLNTKAD